MLHTCYRPIGRCLGRRTGDSLLWHKDLKPQASGDFSIAVVRANSSLEDQAQVLTSPSTTYIGVYDGHGGPDASRFITTHLFPHLHVNALLPNCPSGIVPYRWGNVAAIIQSVDPMGLMMDGDAAKSPDGWSFVSPPIGGPEIGG